MPGMKSSTIKTVLNKKLKNWLDSISDEAVRKIAADNVIVTGGAIASMLQGDAPNDYDLYFKTKEATVAIATYYVGVFNKMNPITVSPGVTPYTPQVRVGKRKNVKGIEEERVLIYMKSAGVAGEKQEEYKYFEGQAESEADNFVSSLLPEDKTFEEVTVDPIGKSEQLHRELQHSKTMGMYRPVFLSENAVSLSDKVQLVIRFFGPPAAIHENYDFAHCMCFFDYGSQILELKQEALEAILSKSLIYKGSLYPVASVFRMRKFMSRGWRITAGQQLKMLWQISEINLQNPEVLKEQLIGVDQAYMHQLIGELKKAEGKVDSAYIAKLIDEIFE